MPKEEFSKFGERPDTVVTDGSAFSGDHDYYNRNLIFRRNVVLCEC